MTGRAVPSSPRSGDRSEAGPDARAAAARCVDLVLFDLAGTTIRDDGMVLAAFRRVVAAHDLPVDDAWIMGRMGQDKEAVFRAALVASGAEADAARRAPALAAEFAAAVAVHVASHGAEAMPGAHRAIDALVAGGVRVGFTTGFARATGLAVLEAAGLPTKLLVASDEVAAGRPAPDLIHEAMHRAGITDVQRTGVVGDTPADLAAGTAAGCRLIVGVAHGTHDAAALAAHPHTHVLRDLEGCASLVFTGDPSSASADSAASPGRSA